MGICRVMLVLRKSHFPWQAARRRRRQRLWLALAHLRCECELLDVRGCVSECDARRQGNKEGEEDGRDVEVNVKVQVEFEGGAGVSKRLRAGQSVLQRRQ